VTSVCSVVVDIRDSPLVVSERDLRLTLGRAAVRVMTSPGSTHYCGVANSGYRPLWPIWQFSVRPAVPEYRRCISSGHTSLVCSASVHPFFRPARDQSSHCIAQSRLPCSADSRPYVMHQRACERTSGSAAASVCRHLRSLPRSRSGYDTDLQAADCSATGCGIRDEGQTR